MLRKLDLQYAGLEHALDSQMFGTLRWRDAAAKQCSKHSRSRQEEAGKGMRRSADKRPMFFMEYF